MLQLSEHERRMVFVHSNHEALDLKDVQLRVIAPTTSKICFSPRVLVVCRCRSARVSC